MDKKKLEVFKKRLEERQRQLRRTVMRTEQDGRDADLDSAQDVADRAANSYNKEFLFHQSNSERQLLQMVEGALTVSVKEPTASAFPVARRLTQNVWKPCPGPVTVSNARKNWKRDFWKNPLPKHFYTFQCSGAADGRLYYSAALWLS